MLYEFMFHFNRYSWLVFGVAGVIGAWWLIDVFSKGHRQLIDIDSMYSLVFKDSYLHVMMGMTIGIFLLAVIFALQYLFL